jgi:hypothetical protein
MPRHTSEVPPPSLLAKYNTAEAMIRCPNATERIGTQIATFNQEN